VLPLSLHPPSTMSDSPSHLPGAGGPAEADGSRHWVPAGPKRRVLVVEDNCDAAEMMHTLLSAAGHEVRAATSGGEALRTVSEFRPDVGFFDIGLPDMNGYDLAREVRRNPAGAAMLLVAVTGWSQTEDRKRALEAGFDAHITKPIDPGAIERLMRTGRPEIKP